MEECPLTNRDILEYTYSYTKSNGSASSVVVHEFLVKHKILASNFKSFQTKFSNVEKRYLKLKKSHNARCQREGSHQNREMENHLNKLFLRYKEVLTLPNHRICFNHSDTCCHGANQGDLLVKTKSTQTPSLLSDELKTPNKPTEVRPSNMTDASVQVSSPQVTTEGQLGSKKRSSKRKLFVQEKELLKSTKKLKVKKERSANSEIKHKLCR